MKKLLLSVIALYFSVAVFGQEAADKKIQAGLVVGTGFDMQQVGTKYFTKNGVGSDLTIGANVNFNFTNTIGLTTGIEFDFSRMNFKANPNYDIYYRYDDAKIFRKGDTQGNESLMQLSERNQRMVYMTIPTMVLFRTNYFGYFRYFGKFGLKHSFLLGSKSFDKGTLYEDGNLLAAGVSGDNKSMKLNAGSDLFFYRGSVGLAAGAEWNFSGPTCLVAEIGYYYGFTPMFYNRKEDKRSLFYTSAEPGGITQNYINNVARQSQLLLKISILF